MAAQAKSLILALAAFVFSQAALASPQLARTWGDEAVALRTALEAERAALRLDPRRTDLPGAGTRTGLMRFAGQADGLAHAIDTGEGPKDLACIFRGMSEEVGVQLDVLDQPTATPAERLRSMERLLKAADDAVAVADAAELVFAGSAGSGGANQGKCPGGSIERPQF